MLETKLQNCGVFRKSFVVAQAIEDEEDVFRKRRHQSLKEAVLQQRLCREVNPVATRKRQQRIDVCRSHKKDGGVMSPSNGNGLGRTGRGQCLGTGFVSMSPELFNSQV